MLNLAAVFLGGGIGAVIRYMTGMLMLKYSHYNLPFSTFIVNIAGSFIIGFLYVLFIDKPEINPALKMALTVGFCGGLTTFSTFSLELFEMAGNQRLFLAFSYTAVSVILCLIAVSLGAILCKTLLNSIN